MRSTEHRNKTIPTPSPSRTSACGIEQPRGGNRHAVFFTHAGEVITYHYERDPSDPRVQHALTLEVDPYGNVLKEAAIGYGRRHTIRVVDAQGVAQEMPNEVLNQLNPDDRQQQTDTLVTYTENRVTNPIDDVAVDPNSYRTPLSCETRTFELTGYTPTGAAGRFQSTDFVQAAGNGLTHVFVTEIDYESLPTNGKQRRLIEQVRTLYRADDLGAAQNDQHALLSLGTLHARALPGESYKLALTPGLLSQVFQRDGQPLLPNPANVLGGQAPTGAVTCRANNSRRIGGSPTPTPMTAGGSPPDVSSCHPPATTPLLRNSARHSSISSFRADTATRSRTTPWWTTTRTICSSPVSATRWATRLPRPTTTACCNRG